MNVWEKIIIYMENIHYLWNILFILSLFSPKFKKFKIWYELNKEINDDILITKLLNKIKKEKGISLEVDNNLKKQELNKNNVANNVNKPGVNKKKELPKTRTTIGSLNNQNNLEKSIVNLSILDKVIYGVILNKKYNQYIMINFGMDYRNYNKKEKKLIHKYHQIYDIYNNYKEKDKDKDEFFYIEKTKYFNNVIYVNEFFVIICSFNFLINSEEIIKKCREILKNFKKNENKYFIVYK